MASKIQTISSAFVLLGRTAVNDISSSAPPIVLTAVQMYDIFYPEMLTRSTWRFSVLAQDLIKNTTPSSIRRFKNIFQMPSLPKYLKAVRVDPRSDFEIYEDQLYSNLEEIQLEYVGLVDEQHWPPYFETLMILKMAEIMAMPVTENPQIAQLYEGQMSRAFRVAQALDAQSRPSNVVPPGPIFSSHYNYDFESQRS